MTGTLAHRPCRRGAARGRRPAIEATLAPSTVARLLAQYEVDRRAWRTSGRIGEARRRLEAAHQALLAAAEAIGDLVPADLAVIGRSRDDADQQLATIDAFTAAVVEGLADLAARGGGRGGNRLLLALYQMPPRFALAVSCRQALAEQLGREPRRAELIDSLAAILAAADEGEAGLDDLVRALPRLLENQGAKAVGSPLHQTLRPCLPAAQANEGSGDGDRHRHTSDSNNP